jgi:hypothetical protein
MLRKVLLVLLMAAVLSACGNADASEENGGPRISSTRLAPGPMTQMTRQPVWMEMTKKQPCD